MNVQVPLHLVPAEAGVVPTGTLGLQPGMAGLPGLHSTPWFTSLEGLVKVTVPPALMTAVAGFQVKYPPALDAWIVGAVSELATDGSTTTAAPSSAAGSASKCRRLRRSCPRILISHQDAGARGSFLALQSR